MRRRLTLLFALLLALATPAAGSATAFPNRIDLPDNFAPEGIAIGRGHTFFTGSLSLQGIWRGDLRSGEGAFLVEGGGPFVGMKADAQDRLWVAGGPAGTGYLFDAATGTSLATIPLAPAGEASFVNDVVVTGDAAYFTDSFRGVVYRVSLDGTSVSEVDLTAIAPAAPGVFRLNGIDATPNGDMLIIVDSTAGALYSVDAASGNAAPIDLGGATVTAGDGIVLHGQTLYVVRNAANLIAVVHLAPGRATGTVVGEIEGDFDVPTTAARFGSALYVVNARFGTTDPDPLPDPYWVTRVDR
jgi:sugar lactone lactonase YvrE